MLHVFGYEPRRLVGPAADTSIALEFSAHKHQNYSRETWHTNVEYLPIQSHEIPVVEGAVQDAPGTIFQLDGQARSRPFFVQTLDERGVRQEPIELIERKISRAK